MESHNLNGLQGVQKQEDVDTDSKGGGDKRDQKPIVRTLNRVPRACNACRKQKMRCEGAENPPCKRCKHAGLECLFEKPSREASLTGEAGLERIRSLEAHVADIRQGQHAIQNTLAEIVAHLRGSGAIVQRSPTTFSQPYANQSPNMQPHSSPPMSTPTSTAPRPLMIDTVQSHSGQSANGHQPNALVSAHGSTGIHANGSRSHSMHPYGSPPPSATGQPPMSANPIHSQSPNQYPSVTQVFNQGNNLSAQSLGSISHIPGAVNGAARYGDNTHMQRHQSRHSHPSHAMIGSKRPGVPSSNVTSADSTDAEDEEGELPTSGLVAPWEVLRGLANVAVEQAAKDGGLSSSEPQSRARTPEIDPRQPRPSKRRKTSHSKSARAPTFPDVVTKQIVAEAEARELFRIFYHGCSTFLPVFDAHTDTYESLHERSPFAVNCICMVAALVRDGGGSPSDTFLRCQDEVHSISQATLFLPVTRQEPVRAMILVSGWSDNGWLSGGHAVRMAMELSMHKAWPKLLRRMQANKASISAEDRELVTCARTWFCLYLFEHQMSYGTGRPAILRDDESIWQCRLLLQHPLSIEDDMRLVSTVELMAIRERVHNKLSPLDRPIDDYTFNVLREADAEFRNWYAGWDQAFSQKYENAAFYRQSLQIQHLHAELFHNSIALRNINGPRDVQNMPAAQRELAVRTVQIAKQGLDITVNSPAYREGMKYAVHYTQATATFTASFLLRLARLFPEDCDINQARTQVEQLATLMSEIPGKRYALTLKLMLKRSKKRQASSQSRSPRMPREPRPQSNPIDPPPVTVPVHHDRNHHQPFSPTYDPSLSPENLHAPYLAAQGLPQHFTADAANIDHIWRGFEMTSTEQLPVWLSDQNLGGASFTQNGMDAFMLPADFLPPAPQVW
ncbi:hypothetical protein JAAARDRAFT_188957 [Jaapia argillacea MUCL 33604]|uniref:Zn(2)-C6 fungal-type domain-containing protein n=1 Tax=Jaapia argillacea MUCL 33604 TaxID=933084 RepID=A0A067Q8R2_9AGAM|nr:hypothetical protein JAAARDRAFT_188957 [Jaapia argillacea MUCL 33604]